jgi:hypothetical protein
VLSPSDNMDELFKYYAKFYVIDDNEKELLGKDDFEGTGKNSVINFTPVFTFEDGIIKSTHRLGKYETLYGGFYVQTSNQLGQEEYGSQDTECKLIIEVEPVTDDPLFITHKEKYSGLTSMTVLKIVKIYSLLDIDTIDILNIKINAFIMMTIAAHGDIALYEQFLARIGDQTDLAKAFYVIIATFCTTIDKLEWIAQNYDITELNNESQSELLSDIIGSTIRACNTEKLQWFCDHELIIKSVMGDYFMRAIETNNIEIFELAKQCVGRIEHPDNIFTSCFTKFSDELFEWICCNKYLFVNDTYDDGSDDNSDDGNNSDDKSTESTNAAIINKSFDDCITLGLTGSRFFISADDRLAIPSISILKLMFDYDVNIDSILPMMIKSIASKNTPDYLTMLYEQRKLIFTDEVIDEMIHSALSGGNVPILNWAKDNDFEIDVELDQLIITAVAAGHVSTLDWIYKNYEKSFIKTISKKKKTSVFEKETIFNTLIFIACENNHVDVLNWFTSKKTSGTKQTINIYKAFYGAVRNGSIDVLTWLTAKFKLDNDFFKIIEFSDSYFKSTPYDLKKEGRHSSDNGAILNGIKFLHSHGRPINESDLYALMSDASTINYEGVSPTLSWLKDENILTSAIVESFLTKKLAKSGSYTSSKIFEWLLTSFPEHTIKIKQIVEESTNGVPKRLHKKVNKSDDNDDDSNEDNLFKHHIASSSMKKLMTKLKKV